MIKRVLAEGLPLEALFPAASRLVGFMQKTGQGPGIQFSEPVTIVPIDDETTSEALFIYIVIVFPKPVY
jgi:hypothetical protein